MLSPANATAASGSRPPAMFASERTGRPRVMSHAESAQRSRDRSLSPPPSRVRSRRDSLLNSRVHSRESLNARVHSKEHFRSSSRADSVGTSDSETSRSSRLSDHRFLIRRADRDAEAALLRSAPLDSSSSNTANSILNNASSSSNPPSNSTAGVRGKHGVREKDIFDDDDDDDGGADTSASVERVVEEFDNIHVGPSSSTTGKSPMGSKWRPKALDVATSAAEKTRKVGARARSKSLPRSKSLSRARSKSLGRGRQQPLERHQPEEQQGRERGRSRERSVSMRGSKARSRIPSRSRSRSRGARRTMSRGDSSVRAVGGGSDDDDDGNDGGNKMKRETSVRNKNDRLRKVRSATKVHIASSAPTTPRGAASMLAESFVVGSSPRGGGKESVDGMYNDDVRRGGGDSSMLSPGQAGVAGASSVSSGASGFVRPSAPRKQLVLSPKHTRAMNDANDLRKAALSPRGRAGVDASRRSHHPKNTLL